MSFSLYFKEGGLSLSCATLYNCRVKISVIIPDKNQSSAFLPNLRNVFLPYFDSLGITYDVLIVADGSSEEEWEILRKEMPSFPAHVKLLPDEGLKGKGNAIKKGFLAADGDYVLFFDADGATDIHVFDEMKKDLGKVDGMIASRDAKGSVYVKKQPFMRRLTHFGARMVVKMKFHMKGVKDTQCGFKCFRGKLAKEMARRQIIGGFAFDVEYLYFLYLNGYSIKEYPCAWTDDAEGSSVKGVSKTSRRFASDLKIIKKNKTNYILTPEEKEALC